MQAITFPEVFDSSMLASFKKCPEDFRKAYIEHWKPKELSVHLHAGKAFATGTEVARRAFYEEGKDADRAIAEGLGALLKAYGDFECPPDSPKSAERMAGAFEFYFDAYPLRHDQFVPITLAGGKRGIEFSFVHPLPLLHPETGNPLLYCGRLDALVSHLGGTYMVDEKTTSQLGASWGRQWDLRSQFTGYAWGGREAGIRIDGIIVRGISILKTKYDTLDPITYRPEWMIDQWFEELLEWIEDIKRCWERSRLGFPRAWKHNYDHACAEYGGCAFRQTCLSQDEKPWLDTYFSRRKWDPILREEIPL